MKFKVLDVPLGNSLGDKQAWCIITWPYETSTFAEFPFRDNNKEIVRALAQDYCDFLNDKYLDKEINAEWPIIDDNIKQKRIKYHIEELNKLGFNDRIVWGDHGNEVK